jgi:hypothetical protein
VHGAGAALPAVAALLRAGDGEALAQGVQERDAGIDVQVLGGAVDLE